MALCPRDAIYQVLHVYNTCDINVVIQNSLQNTEYTQQRSSLQGVSPDEECLATCPLSASAIDTWSDHVFLATSILSASCCPAAGRGPHVPPHQRAEQEKLQEQLRAPCKFDHSGGDRRLFWCGRSKKRSIDGCGRRLSAVELRAMRWHHGRRCAGQYGAASPDHPKGSPTPAEPSAEAGRFPCVIGQIPSGLQNCRQRHTVHGRQPVRLQWRHGSRSAMQEQARSATAPGHDGTTTKSSTSKRRAGSRPSTLDTQHRHSTPTLANTHVDTKWLKCDLDTYHIWSTDTDPTLSRRSSNRRAGTGLGLSQAPTVPPKSGVWAQNPPTPSQAPLRSNAA